MYRLISEVFDKIYSAVPTLRLVFIPPTSTICNKTKNTGQIFFENYIYGKFHQNRWLLLPYIPLLDINASNLRGQLRSNTQFVFCFHKFVW